MRAFARLYERLDETTKTARKVDALAEYFAAAAPADAAWALAHLLGDRPRRLVSTARLGQWAAAAASIPQWLFEECYSAVGDLAETIALLLAAPQERSPEPSVGPQAPAAARDRAPSGSDLAGAGSLAWWIEQRLLPLGELDEERQRAALIAIWRELEGSQLLLWNKLITGSFRVGVSRGLVLRALERVTGVRAPVLAHRLMGRWQPTADAFRRLTHGDERDADLSQPYPFLLAHPLLEPPDQQLGERGPWQVEWKWDGIRAQLVRRGNSSFLWSRGEELITERFPEIAEAARALPPGVVLDGELVALAGDGIGSFGALQRRIGRTKLTPRILREVPVVLLAFDLLEDGGVDLRAAPLAARRERLAAVIVAAGVDRLRLAPLLPDGASWTELGAARAAAREAAAEGLMIKRLDADYGVGRVRGSWWKWKVDPFSVDAVLLYAQRGHGRRASLYTDYTFGVWDGDSLVPLAKAYSGLTDAELQEVDRFVRRNSRESFGPVRAVAPELVFEIAFEGIQPSNRHKSGVAVRFPRILRWRRDKLARDADSLSEVLALAESRGPSPESRLP